MTHATLNRVDVFITVSKYAHNFWGVSEESGAKPHIKIGRIVRVKTMSPKYTVKQDITVSFKISLIVGVTIKSSGITSWDDDVGFVINNSH